jgi:hypothetical protein
MSLHKNIRACWLAGLLSPGIAPALTVDIQGVHLEPATLGASCVDIKGDYPGVRIEADQPGQTPRVCHSASRLNLISIANATLVATAPLQREVVISFSHEFPSGINGKVTARTKLQGFFATDTGVGVPTGDKLNLRGIFSQSSKEDVIAEPFDFTVGEEMDTAMFEHSVKKQYLVVGPRNLKGVVKVAFKKAGHKLTFPGKFLISLDTGSTFEDKLEMITPLDEEESASPGQEGAPSAEPAPKLEPFSAPDSPAAPAPSKPAPSKSKLPPLPELEPLKPLP